MVRIRDKELFDLVEEAESSRAQGSRGLNDERDECQPPGSRHSGVLTALDGLAATGSKQRIDRGRRKLGGAHDRMGERHVNDDIRRRRA